jgi:hypothetical protein
VPDLAPFPQYDRFGALQRGVYGTPGGLPPSSSMNLSTNNRLYAVRFVPLRVVTVTFGALSIGTAEVGADDPSEIGLYDANGNILTRSGSAAGRLTALGRVKLPMQTTYVLLPRTTYLSVLVNSYTGTTAPAVSSVSFGSGQYVDLFGDAANPTLGLSEVFTMSNGSAVLPNTLSGALSTINNGPAIAWRET